MTPSHRRLAVTLSLGLVFLACKSEEEIRLYSDGSGRAVVRLTVDNELAGALAETERELERRGMTVRDQRAGATTTTLSAERSFSSVQELSDGVDRFLLEIQRDGFLRRTYRLRHVASSSPRQVGFSRVVKITFPVPVRKTNAGTSTGRTVVWDGSSGGTLAVEASGYVLPFGPRATALFWVSVALLLIGVLAQARLRAVPERRCGRCQKPIAPAIRFCPSCGTPNDVPGEENGVRSIPQPALVRPLRLLARIGSACALGVVLVLVATALPEELSPPAIAGSSSESDHPVATALDSDTPDSISPESFLESGAFDPATGRIRIWYLRLADSQFALFDGPGFDPTSRQRLQPLTPDLLREVEAWAREESSKRRVAAELHEREQVAAEAARREAAAREEEERLLGQYIDRLALGRTPARRAVVVHLIPARGLTLDGLMSSVSSAVEGEGFETIPLFKRDVSRDGIDRELFAGSASRARQLRLREFCNVLVLGEVHESRPPTWANRFYLAEVALELHVIDPGTGRVLRTSEASAKGGGPSREAARAAAVDELRKSVPSATRNLFL